MDLEKSESIDLVAFSDDVSTELMGQILEMLLPTANQVITPSFIEPEAEYLGRIVEFKSDFTDQEKAELFNMCFSNLELFSITSERADGLVMLRKGDEMTIMTEHNVQVIHEDAMSEVMDSVKEAMAEVHQKRQKSGDKGMFG